MAVGITLPEKLSIPQKTKPLIWVAVSICVLVGILLVVFAAKWPFTKEAMIKRLERASSAHVEMRGFHGTYFPYPGCVAEGVTFHLPASSPGEKAPPPIVSIAKLTIKSTFTGLFSKPGKIKTIIADGLRVHVPEGGANLHSDPKSQKDQVVIEEIRAENAVLEVETNPAKEPLVFQIHRIKFSNVNAKNTIPFEVALRLPLPPGEAESYGWIGPGEGKPLRSAPISGTYVVKDANLGVFSSLAGKVSSRGNFSGNLDRINIQGNTSMPDFEVKESGHSFPLSTQFSGILDLNNADLTLSTFKAKLGKTELDARATVLGSPKTVTLNVLQGQGEIQDLFLLFSKAPRSPITGPVVFHTRVVLPPEHRPFKERVQLTGDFKIDPAKFTSPNTQKSIDKLSERAEGKKDKKDNDADNDVAGNDRVLSDLNGKVLLKNGVATFSDTSFLVPGAHAKVAGTYSLLNTRVNFHGTLRMQATVSQATTGVKSFILKVADPFFKKKHAGAEVPISMTGTDAHPHFTAGP